MKNKAKLAFELLEQEMEVIYKEDLKQVAGGVQRDANGNIIFTAVEPFNTYDYSGNPVSMIKGYILADDGTQIVAYRNDSNSPMGYDTDCHGTTFADGQYWINNDQTCSILTGDGYAIIGESTGANSSGGYSSGGYSSGGYSSGGYSSGGYSPDGYAVGDVVVYYDSNGNLAHSLTITGFSEDGTPMVYGQGGEEIFNSTTSIENGWANYSSYQVYRK